MPARAASARISPAVMKLSCPTNSPGGVRRDARAPCSARSNGARSSCLIGRDENAVRKRSRNAAIGQTGACGPGSMPSCQPHPAIRSSTFGSLGDDRDRHVVAGALAADDRRGLVVAEHDQHEVVVAVALHEREERAQRVLDRVPVGGAGPLGVAEQRGRRGLLRRDAVEDRAVADVVPAG